MAHREETDERLGVRGLGSHHIHLTEQGEQIWGWKLLTAGAKGS